MSTCCPSTSLNYATRNMPTRRWKVLYSAVYYKWLYELLEKGICTFPGRHWSLARTLFWRKHSERQQTNIDNVRVHGILPKERYLTR